MPPKTTTVEAPKLRDPPFEKWENKPLHKAAYYADVEQVKKLLGEGASLGPGDDPIWQSPLIFACRAACYTEEELKNRTEVVKMLVDAGSDLDTFDKYGDPPIILACMDGNQLDKYPIVEVLVNAGAKLDCQCTNFKMNPLHWAAIGGHAKIATLLLEKSTADRNCRDLSAMKDVRKDTPLGVAKRQTEEVAKFTEVIAILEAAKPA